MRVDRFLSNLPQFNRKQVRLLLVERRVTVEGVAVSDPHHDVREFSQVCVDGEILQAGKPARYFMLHKPQGCVSATSDPQHSTVLDLLHEPDKADLHIAGRLDFNTKLPKVYHVQTEQDIGPQYAMTFAAGVYFAFEDLTTQPAKLERLGPRTARLSIVEGRYHQVKRMFGHFDNKVIGLHRERMGPLVLDTSLAPGQYRPLTDDEIRLI